MNTQLDLFFRAPGTRPWIVIACLLVASLLEGIGIASLLPLLNLLTGQADDQPTGLEGTTLHCGMKTEVR